LLPKSLANFLKAMFWFLTKIYKFLLVFKIIFGMNFNKPGLYHVGIYN